MVLVLVLVLVAVLPLAVSGLARHGHVELRRLLGPGVAPAPPHAQHGLGDQQVHVLVRGPELTLAPGRTLHSVTGLVTGPPQQCSVSTLVCWEGRAPYRAADCCWWWWW